MKRFALRLQTIAFCLSTAMALLCPALPAFASVNSGITYHGRILKPDGTPLEGSTVQFKLEVLSPGAEACMLYSEVQTIDMAGSSGVFSISLDDGTGTRIDNSGVLFDSVFSNRSTYNLPAGTCAQGSSYTPNIGDGRSFVVLFKDENMSSFEQLPSQAVNFAPMAIQAKQVGGFAPNNLLRVDDATSASNLTPLNSTQFNNFMGLVNGSYVSSGANGASLPVLTGSPTSPTAGAFWYNSGTGSLQYYNGSATVTLGTGGGGSPTGSATGDLSGSYPSPNVAKINGTTVSTSSLASGNYLRYNGSAWVNVNIQGTDLPSLATGYTGILPIADGGTGTSTGSITGSGALTFTAGGTNQNVTLAPSGSGVTVLGNSVGIGTTSPNTFLEVEPGFALGNMPGGWTGGLHTWDIYAEGGFGMGSNGTLETYLTNAGNGSFLGQLGVGTYAGTSRLSVNGAISAGSYYGTAAPTNGMIISGNVGVGTSSPGSAFDLNGAFTARGMAAPTVSSAGQGRIYFDSTSNTFLVSQNGSTYTNLVTSTGAQNFSSDITMSGAGTGLAVTNSATVGGTLGVTGSISGSANLNMTTTSTVATAGTNQINSLGVTYNPATAPAASTAMYGLYTQTTTAGSSDLTNASITAGEFFANHNTTSNLNALIGSMGVANNNSSGTISTASGSDGNLVNSSSGTITSGSGGTFEVKNTGAGTISSSYGLFVQAPANTGGGTISNYYGLFIGTPTAATTDYAIYSQGGTNYFGGNVGIGTTSPSVTLQVDRSSMAGTSASIMAKGNNDGSIYSSLSLQASSLPDNWVMGHMGSNHDLLFFNYNGSYTNVLQLQENGGIATGSYANTVQASPNALVVGGSVGIGTSSTTASLNIRAGTSAIAPLQLTAGTNLTTPIAGSIEFDGTNLYYTNSSNARMTLSTASSTGSVAMSDTDTTTSGASADDAYTTTFAPASSSTATVAAEKSVLQTGSTQTMTGSTLRGFEGQSNNVGSGTTATQQGVLGDVYNNSSGTITVGQGLVGAVSNTGTGTIGNAYAGYFGVSNTSTGTITNGYGLAVGGPTNSGGGTFTNFYGLYLNTPTAATNNYALYSVGGTNYFGGNVGIGTTSPVTSLQVAGNTFAAGGISLGDGTDGFYQSAPGSIQVMSGGTNRITLQSGTIQFNGGASPYITIASPSFRPRSGEASGLGWLSAGVVALYSSGSANFVLSGSNVGIGTTSPLASLDLSAKTDAIALPKGTSMASGAIAGMIRYNTTSSAVEFYNGSAWASLSSGGGSYLSSSGGTLSGGLTISSGGLNNTAGGITNAGSITGVGSNITGSGAMTVAAGGTAQNLTLSSSTSGSVILGSGNGTSLSVLDAGTGDVNYVTIQGAATGVAPTIGVAGSDTNIPLNINSKGAANVRITTNGYTQFKVINNNNAVNYVQVEGGTTGNAVGMMAAGSDTNVGLYLASQGTGGMTFGTGNGNAMRITDAGATAVNYINVTGGATGNAPIIAATGSDTNVNLTLSPKGSGNTLLSSGSLGIGTASPTAPTHIYGAASSSNVLERLETSTSPGRMLSFKSGGTDWNFWMGSEAVSNLYIASSSSAAFYFWRANWSTAGVAANTFQDANNTANATTVAEIQHQNAGDTGDYLHITNVAGGTTGNIMTVTNAGYVGIGTTSPISALHVNGTIYGATGLITNQQLHFGDSSMYFNGPTTGTTSYLSTVVNNSEIMRVQANGNIGIGTTSPVSTLDLSAKTDAIALPKGTSMSSGAIAGMIRYNTTNTAVEFYNGTAWASLTSGGGSYLSSSGGTLSGGLTISSGGLNNTSGGITNAGSITGVGTNLTGAGSLTVAAGGTAQTLSLNASTTGSVNVGNGDGTSLSVIDGGASTVDYITVKGSAAAGSPTIATAGSDTNINLSISPKGTGNTLITSGNVGIGTTSPTALFDAQGGSANFSVGNYGLLNVDAAAGGESLNVQPIYGSYYLNLNAKNVGYWVDQIAYTPSQQVAFTTSGDMQFNTAPATSGGAIAFTTDLIVKNNGNVGVGVLVPAGPLSASPLQYSTGTASQAGSTVTGSGTTWTSAMVGSQFIFMSGVSAGVITAFNSATSLTVSTSQTIASGVYSINYTGLNMNSTGNVGIGTTNPSQSLEIAGAGLSSGSNAEFAVKNTTTGNWVAGIYNDYGHGRIFATDSNGGGGVSLGQANSSQPNYINVGTGLSINSTSMAQSTVDINGGVSVGTYATVNAAPSNGMIISGSVGIGTTSPSEVLEVNGNIKADGQMVSKSQTITGGTTSINWNNGNAISTDYNCASNFSFANLRDGGTYTLMVIDSGTTQCNFSSTTTGNDAATVTYRFKPANAARTASTYTIYTLMRIGTVVLVSWTSGF